MRLSSPEGVQTSNETTQVIVGPGLESCEPQRAATPPSWSCQKPPYLALERDELRLVQYPGGLALTAEWIVLSFREC